MLRRFKVRQHNTSLSSCPVQAEVMLFSAAIIFSVMVRSDPRSWPNAGPMPGRRRRRRPGIGPAFAPGVGLRSEDGVQGQDIAWRLRRARHTQGTAVHAVNMSSAQAHQSLERLTESSDYYYKDRG